jgi:GTP-binding protein
MPAYSETALHLPAIVIVGRPNVGKSTLFNRLTGKRLALVDDRPGVTRDRREGEGRIGGLKFRIVDTAGLEDAGPDTLARRMTEQSRKAIEAADVCLFMIDARAGVTPADQHFADLVRRSGKPVVLLANKAEGGKGEDGRLEGYSLGLGEPISISAEHGEGLGDLHDALQEAFELACARCSRAAQCRTKRRPMHLLMTKMSPPLTALCGLPSWAGPMRASPP